MTRRLPGLRTGVALTLTVLLLALGGAPAFGQTPAAPAAKLGDLDAFMEKVLKRRELNRQILEQYVLDEFEQFEVLGPSRMPVYRQRKDFTWYVRDGLHVRSPVRVNGAAVGDEARTRYEESWARRERAKGWRSSGASTPCPTSGPWPNCWRVRNDRPGSALVRGAEPQRIGEAVGGGVDVDRRLHQPAACGQEAAQDVAVDLSHACLSSGSSCPSGQAPGKPVGLWPQGQF